MQELIDSSRSRADGSASGARLGQDGHLVLRGLLPAEDMRGVRRGLLGALVQSGWLASGAPFDAPVPIAHVVHDAGADTRVDVVACGGTRNGSPCSGAHLRDCYCGQHPTAFVTTP